MLCLLLELFVQLLELFLRLLATLQNLIPSRRAPRCRRRRRLPPPASPHSPREAALLAAPILAQREAEAGAVRELAIPLVAFWGSRCTKMVTDAD